LAVAVVGGILFSGCVAPPQAPPEVPVTAPEPTPDGTPIPIPTNQDSVLITYECSGGIMGIHDQLTIYADGRCELQRELPGKDVYREFTIPPSQLAHLKELMEAPDFLGCEGVGVGLPPPGADLEEYVISYYHAGEGKMRTKIAWTSAIPDCLLPIMHELNQLMKQIYSTVILVRYRRYGGIAGLDDELAIYTDGRCELRRKDVEWEFTIQPSQLEHLKELMEEANFLGLKETYGSRDTDLVEYTISYYPEEGCVKIVSAWTTAIPDALLPIIHELDQIIDQNSILISYERSGGIAGLHDQLTVYFMGHCKLQRIDQASQEDTIQFTLCPSQLEHLKELMDDPDFLGCEGVGLPPPGADLFEYRISYYDGEHIMRTKIAWDSAIPDCLLPIMHELDQIKQLAEVTGSQEMATWEMDFADFTWIEVGSGFDVDITQSDSYSVTITANENLFDYLEIRQSGVVLYIYLKQANYINARLEATITLPELRRLDLEGASRGRISGYSSTNPLSLHCSGASSLEIEAVKAGDTGFSAWSASQITGSIETADCSFDLEENSTIELTGSGNDANILALGGSSVRLADFPIINAQVHLAGVDDATITLSGRLDPWLSHASTLYYSGNPTLGRILVSDDSKMIKL
jgi:hypothetical protein